jgi:putative ABC transport system permease protein
VGSGRGNDRGPGANQRPRGGTPNKPAPPLDDDALDAFTKLANVAEVYPQIRFSTDIRYQGNKFTNNALGIPESARRGEAFDGMTGKFFSSATAEEVILQLDLAQQLVSAPPKHATDEHSAGSGAPNPTTNSPAPSTPPVADLIGKTITIRYAERASFASAADRDDALLESAMTGQLAGSLSMVPKERPLRVVGIVETDPSASMGGFGGGKLFLPLQLAESLHVAQPSDLQALINDTQTKTAYTAVTVRVKSPKDVAVVEGTIKKMGYSTFSLLDATKGLQIVFTIFDSFLTLFGGLALTVASLGIINTLMMAILERRREIGVLKALGATDGDVKSLFFAEAATMGFFGGILGLLFGWLIGLGLSAAIGFYLRQQDLPSVQISHVPLWLAALAIAFGTGVSLLAGLYPAAHAAQLDPVEALRYE